MTTDPQDPADDLEPIDIGDAPEEPIDIGDSGEDDYEPDYDMYRKDDDLDDSSLTLPAPIPAS